VLFLGIFVEFFRLFEQLTRFNDVFCGVLANDDVFLLPFAPFEPFSMNFFNGYFLSKFFGFFSDFCCEKKKINKNRFLKIFSLGDYCVELW
jgi:hypothetical protein